MALVNQTPGGSQVRVTVTHGPAPASQNKATSAPKSGKARAAKTAAAPKAASPAKASSAQGFNPLGGFMSSSQLGSLANNIQSANTQASVKPLQAQNATLNNEEKTAQGRYSGYMNTAQQIIQGLQQNAGNSALSNENAAAQAANTTANAIDQTGSAAAALAGGWMSPGMQAALQSQSQFQGTTQGAEANLINSQGANSQDFLNNIRATTALQGVEGQQNIASSFQKPIATNNAQIASLLAKEVPASKQLAATLGQQQFTDYATLLADKTKASTAQATKLYQQGELQNKNQANQIAAQRVNVTAQNNAANQKLKAQQIANTYALGAQRNQTTLTLGQEKVNETAANNAANERIKAIDAQIAEGKLTETQRHDLVNERIAWTKALSSGSSSAPTKTADLITGEGYYYKNLTTVGGSKGPISGKLAGTAVTTNLKNDGPAAQAAIELGSKGYVTTQTAGQLGPQVVAALRAQGVSIGKPAAAKPLTPAQKLAAASIKVASSKGK